MGYIHYFNDTVLVCGRSGIWASAHWGEIHRLLMPPDKAFKQLTDHLITV